jgi:hypothetical protein
LSKRWLDKYAEFAVRWDEFQASWKWSQSLPRARASGRLSGLLRFDGRQSEIRYLFGVAEEELSWRSWNGK